MCHGQLKRTALRNARGILSTLQPLPSILRCQLAFAKNFRSGKYKRPLRLKGPFPGAEGRNRTGMSLRTLDFESSASTNFPE